MNAHHDAGLAQLVEHPPCKRKVVSSIPTAGTTISLPFVFSPLALNGIHAFDRIGRKRVLTGVNRVNLIEP